MNACDLCAPVEKIKMCDRKLLFFVLYVTAFGLVLTITSDELRVRLSNGSKLIGKYHRSFNGRPIKAFTSIPYAKPPLGELRFKAPQEIEKWDGEYRAVYDGPKCNQRDPFVRSFADEGTEDCLYLNVYVPHSYEEQSSNLSVLVFFHGGGFVCGTGQQSSYGSEYFLDHDVILVTSNYRLGPLGFLSTEDASCPGNFGLKDQVMVLKWIQKNIKQFGGNPESVTIFGGSAGGASVTYLMMSPLAEGLFSKAIAMSGTNMAPWSQPAHKGVARKRALQLVKKFNCHKPNNWSDSIDCLRGISAENITASFYDFFEFDTDPMVPFPPVVEPNLPGAFITDYPQNGQNDRSLKIPFLTGVTYDEGLMKSIPIVNVPGLFERFANNLNHALSIFFSYDLHDIFVQESITKQIGEFYFNNDLAREKHLNITNLFSDGWFLVAMDSYLRLRLANKNRAQTYVYLLTHNTTASFSDVFEGDEETFYGVSHADEKIYLFPVRESIFYHTLPSRHDEEMRKSMIQLWVNFAQTANPTPGSSHLPKWEEATEFPLNFYRLGNMHFGDKAMFGSEKGGIFEDRTAFWRKIERNFLLNSQKDEL